MSNPDRPVGPVVDPLPPGLRPDLRPLHGRWMRLDALDEEHHGHALYRSFHGKPGEDDIWTWLAYGPFDDEDAFLSYVREKQVSRDPWFYAFFKRETGEALGVGSFMRADAANGVIEIGHIWMSPPLQDTREATEAIYLMIRHAFADLGVRRLEWKCDALNAPSRRAAERLGFTFEGIFRQHYIVKGRNRDTAWYAMLDKDWSRIHQAFEAWLAEGNFDAAGRQKAKLQAA
jgi:RimJ/RimL family protein N-acetyltransferase